MPDLLAQASTAPLARVHAAQRRPLGHSGLAVGPLGWGMWRLAGTPLVQARACIDAALEIGCTLFDTADIYGYGPQGHFGAAEELLGRLLQADPALRDRLVLASKCGIVPGIPYDSRAEYLIGACEASLRRLRVARLDLLQIHRPDVLTHPAEVAAALERLHRDGKVRAVGVSNYTLAQTRALLAHLTLPLASVQPEFSLLNLTALEDGLLDLALERHIAVLAWSPLAQGRLGNAASEGDARIARIVAAVDAMAARCHVSRAALACSWLMAHPARPIPLIGSQSPEHLRALAATYTLSWTRGEWYAILTAARGTALP